MYGTAFVNGRFAGSHVGGFIPFEPDVTGLAVPGAENTLLVYTAAHDKTEHGARTSPRDSDMVYGNLFPRERLESRQMHISGDVELIAKPAVRAEEVYVRTSVADGTIAVSGVVVNDGDAPVRARIANHAREGGVDAFRLSPTEVDVPARDRSPFAVRAEWRDAKRWGIGGGYGDPNHRYTLRTRIDAAGNHGQTFTPFGFREFRIEGRHFALNGLRLAIQGDSFSGSGRYEYQHNRWTHAFTNRLRREACINLVRPHRYNMTAEYFEA